MTTHEINCPIAWAPLNTLRAFLLRLFPADRFNFVESEAASAPQYLETAQPIDPTLVWEGTYVSQDSEVEKAVTFFAEQFQAA